MAWDDGKLQNIEFIMSSSVSFFGTKLANDNGLSTFWSCKLVLRSLGWSVGIKAVPYSAGLRSATGVVGTCQFLVVLRSCCRWGRYDCADWKLLKLKELCSGSSMSLRVVGVCMDHAIWWEGCRQNCTTSCRFYRRPEDLEVPTPKQAVELLT